MTGSSRLVILCGAGATFGLLVTVLSPLAEATDFAGAARGAIAGALFGGAIAILGQVRSTRHPSGAVAPALLFANPLVCFAFLRGEDAALFFAAATLIAGAAVALAALRDFRAAIALGMALALAPFLSGAVLYLYPLLAVALPLISPWGLAPRKAAGFAVVLWSPAIMVLAGIFYLRWLLEPTAAPLSVDLDDAFAGVSAIAGAAVVAPAAFAGSRRAASLAFAAGGGLLALLLKFGNGVI